MELSVTGGMPATPVASAPSQDQMPSDPPVAVVQPAVAESEWPPQQWPPQQWPPQQWPPQQWPPQQWPTQQWPQQPPPQQQPWAPQQQAWPPVGVTSQTWVAAPAVSAAPAVTVTKRRSGRARAVDLIFGLSMLVAVGGVAFAIGRATAPTSTATNAPFTGLGGFPGRTSQNAVVPPAASSAPDVSVQQQAAPSGAPVIPSPGTGTGTGPGAPQGAAPGGFGRGGLAGTVSALGDGTITFTTADGQTTEVTTTDSTTYHQQAVATTADVTVGSSVRITPAGGFGGSAGLSASDVEDPVADARRRHLHARTGDRRREPGSRLWPRRSHWHRVRDRLTAPSASRRLPVRPWTWRRPTRPPITDRPPRPRMPSRSVRPSASPPLVASAPARRRALRQVRLPASPR